MTQSTQVCVTGAAGFIGSHLVEALASQGHHVRALVRYNGRHDIGWLKDLPPELKSQVEITAGDVRDIDCIRKLVSDCDTVYHLAALIAIPYSYTAPQSYVDTNITGTLNILQACRHEKNLRRVIVTSTSEVYGTAQFVPITESHPLQAQSPYSASKMAADHLADSFYRSFDLPVTTLRPFNTYGPRQSMRAVIPTIIRQALESNTISIGNLSPRRDFNFVSDTVQGFLKMAAAPDSVCGQVIQVGTGHDVSIAELIEVIEKLLGTSLDILETEERHRPEKSEVYRLCASIEKAQAELGYTPQVTLEEGLRQSITWYRQHQGTMSREMASAYYV